MVRISWTSQALDDLQAIGDFIARDVPAFAQVFVDKVFENEVTILTIFHGSRLLKASDLLGNIDDD